MIKVKGQKIFEDEKPIYVAESTITTFIELDFGVVILLDERVGNIRLINKLGIEMWRTLRPPTDPTGFTIEQYINVMYDGDLLIGVTFLGIEYSLDFKTGKILSIVSRYK